jgi:SepF-like predicted cell division protein (DUF552 family)
MIGNLLKPGKPAEHTIVEAQMSKEIQARLSLSLMVMERYADLEKILARFRKGDSVLLIRVTPLKDKDINELKKAVDRLKTHCDVTGSDLAALDDNWIVLVPPVVQIAR